MKELENIDMKVYPTQSCSSDCPFCMTDIRYKFKEVDTELFLSNFAEAVEEYHSNGGRKILFTGGEPTNCPDKLLGMLKIIKDYIMDLVVLYTNGTKLLKIEKKDELEKKLIEHLADVGLHSLNISVHHYDANRRQELSREPICDIEEVVREATKNGISVRLNCTLLKDYIGNAEELMKYLDFANRIGVNDIYFRDLFHLENRELSIKYADLKKVNYTDRQRIDFYSLIEIFSKNEEVKSIERLSRHKGQGDTHIFEYRKMRVSFGTLEIGTEDPNHYTYFVFMPDGNVYKNMNGPEFKED